MSKQIKPHTTLLRLILQNPQVERKLLAKLAGISLYAVMMLQKKLGVKRPATRRKSVGMPYLKFVTYRAIYQVNYMYQRRESTNFEKAVEMLDVLLFEDDQGFRV